MPMPYCLYRESCDLMRIHPLLTPLLVLLASLAAFSGVCAGADDPYLAEVLKRAEERQLHQERTWEVLLHYRSRGEERESLVDDPRFFLAPDGKTDPAAELEATLRGLFAPGA